MKTTPFLEYILYDVFDERDTVSARAMMGGYVVYKEGKVIGLADNEKFYLKGSKETEGWFLERGSRKFSYEKKSKDGKKKIQTMNFFLVPEEVLENREEFRNWLNIVF